MFKNCGHMTLRDMVSRHGEMGWWLAWMILEIFTNLNDSVILQLLMESCFRSFNNRSQNVKSHSEKKITFQKIM